MSHRLHLITFDVYTALFDEEGSLVPLSSQDPWILEQYF
jgi:hypothetical protein